MVAHASVASSKPKAELDLNADTCVVGDNCLDIHDHNRPVNVYRSLKAVDATVGYQGPQSGQKFILMMNQAICINGCKNHLPLQLSSLTSYFHVYAPNVAEDENKATPKTHLIVEEPLWDPSTKEYSEHDTHTLDH